MCNDYEQHVKWREYRDTMEKLGLGVPVDETKTNLPETDDIRVNDIAPVMRATGNIVALTPMKWSFPPARPGLKLAFNFRSENRRFSKDQRVVIPATAFFEFTGTKTPKTKWRFSLNGEPIMGIAGIWREAVPGELPFFTMLTTAPGPDVERYHDRQVVVLHPKDWASWLYQDAPEKELLKPLARGSLTVQLYRQGREDPLAGLMEGVDPANPPTAG